MLQKEGVINRITTIKCNWDHHINHSTEQHTSSEFFTWFSDCFGDASNCKCFLWLWAQAAKSPLTFYTNQPIHRELTRGPKIHPSCSSASPNIPIHPYLAWGRVEIPPCHRARAVWWFIFYCRDLSIYLRAGWICQEKRSVGKTVAALVVSERWRITPFP